MFLFELTRKHSVQLSAPRVFVKCVVLHGVLKFRCGLHALHKRTWFAGQGQTQACKALCGSCSSGLESLPAVYTKDNCVVKTAVIQSIFF